MWSMGLDRAKRFLAPVLAAVLMAVLMVFCWVPAVWSGTGLWEASVVHTDSGMATLAWDPSTNECEPGFFCGYELELRHLEIASFVDRYKVPGIATAQKMVAYKRSGHFRIYVRTVKCADEAMTDCDDNVSEWADSISSGMIVVGVPEPKQGPWILYWRLPPPGGGGIE